MVKAEDIEMFAVVRGIAPGGAEFQGRVSALFTRPSRGKNTRWVEIETPDAIVRLSLESNYNLERLELVT